MKIQDQGPWTEANHQRAEKEHCHEHDRSFPMGGECEECCDHDFDPDEGFTCLNCGKDGAEEVMSRAYDRAKDIRKYGE